MKEMSMLQQPMFAHKQGANERVIGWVQTMGSEKEANELNAGPLSDEDPSLALQHPARSWPELRRNAIAAHTGRFR